MNNQNTFSTDSFPLATYLLCESIPLLGTDKTNPKRVLFIFEESELRKERTNDFMSYKTMIEPHRLFSAQKDLKQMIYSKNE